MSATLRAVPRPSSAPVGAGAADARPSPLGRLIQLADGGCLHVVGGGDPGGGNDAAGVLAGVVHLPGGPAVAFATDPAIQGGAMGRAGCEVILDAYRLADRAGWPIIGLWHSGGARLREGVESLHGIGRVFAAITAASGRIPQVSVVLGPAAGGAAYGPALTDVVILGPAGRLFVTGPEVIRQVTGEATDMDSLGGADAHGRRSGVVHLTATSDDEALAAGRRIAGLLADPVRGGPGLEAVADREFAGLLPDSMARAYDVHPLLDTLLDTPGLELHRRWAPNIITQLGTFGGRTVGVVATNPVRLGGCLDATAGDKAARFVRMCDALGVPLLVVVDVPGYLPGVAQEWGGVVRRGAKLLHAFAAARVPRITLVTRKAYGGAYIAMNSRSLGATAVYAWPGAQIDVMGPAAATRILHRRELAVVPEPRRAAREAELVAELTRAAGGLAAAVATGVVDEVIDPDRTRSVIAAALERSWQDPGVRGRAGNIPL